MSVVVERGLARCPRCVAVADYTFVEMGPNSVRYEVRCERCGGSYCEVNSPVVPNFAPAVDSFRLPVRPDERGRPQRVLDWLASAWRRASLIVVAVAGRVASRIRR
jgi:hypothetical protein